MTANTQISTLTFFKFSSLWQKIWAFHMMLFAHIPLRKVKGVSFYKLMGSGKDKGFNPYPDWSVYCLLQVWDTEEQAQSFFAHAPILKAYSKHTQERYTLYMKTIASHGTWDVKQPFEKTTELNPAAPIAIITRASIKWNCLFRFWRYVPKSHEAMDSNKGLIFTKGIGEAPLLQMATFSLWKDIEGVKEFAYKSAQHKEAIKLTRELQWYSEEQFSRFHPYKEEGTWGGQQLLPTIPSIQ
jgi:heme-degrading monooxygenase HmoA